MKAGRLVFFVMLVSSCMAVSRKLANDLMVDLSVKNGLAQLSINKTRPGWAGVGLGSDMSKGEILLVERIPGNNNVVQVRNCYLAGYDVPICTMTQQWTITQNTATSTGFLVTATRSINPSDIHGLPITEGSNAMLFAFTEANLVEFHAPTTDGSSGFGSFLLNLNETVPQMTQDSKNNGLKWGFLRHEYAEAIIWTIPADLLILLARYFKSVPKWKDIHLWTFLFLLILTWITQGTGQKRIPADNPTRAQEHRGELKTHKVFSTLLTIFAIIMIATGVIARAATWFKLSYGRFDTLKWSKIAHLYGGIVTWLFARVCVITGCTYYMAKFDAPLILWLVVAETILFLLIVAIWEIYNRSTHYLPLSYLKLDGVKEVEMFEDNRFIPSKISEILTHLRSPMTPVELSTIHPGLVICLFNNQVYDLSSYSHPGGDWRVKEANWTEVSRYLLGITGIEHEGDQAWNHSKQAFKDLNRNYIGHLYEEGIGIDHHWAIRAEGKVAFASGEFTMLERRPLSQTVSLFKWYNPRFKVATDLFGVRWFGKHYMVSMPSKSQKIRLYTHCLSISDEVIRYDRVAIQLFNARTTGADERLVQFPLMPPLIDYIPMIIKDYGAPTALSTRMHQMNLDDKVVIEGPFGRGFPLHDDFYGEVLLIAGGTGLLPFVDLINFLLKKAMTLVLRRLNLSDDFVYPAQDYVTPFRNTSFTLACSFREAHDFVFEEMVEALVRINDTFQLGLFRCVLRIDGGNREYRLPTTRSYFDKTFFASLYSDLGKLRQVLICGNDKMNTMTFNALHKDLGINPDLIAFV